MNLSPFALPCSRISGEKVNKKVTTGVILQNLVQGAFYWLPCGEWALSLSLCEGGGGLVLVYYRVFSY